MSRPKKGKDGAEVPPPAASIVAAFDAAVPIEPAGKVRMLSGLDRLGRLPAAEVVVCGNPRAAEAAGMKLTDCVCLGVPADGAEGGPIDWSSLKGRHVAVWPDAGAAGVERAAGLADAMRAAGAESVRLLSPPRGVAVGWCALDAFGEAWSDERFAAFVAGEADDGETDDEVPDEAGLPPVARLTPAVLWPYGYEMTAAGLVFRPKDDGPGERLSGPFDLHAMVRTEDGTSWSLAISFRDMDRRLHVVMVSLADLAGGDSSELRRELGDKGLALASGRSAREKFVAALAGVRVDTRALLVGKAGWHVNGTVYAAPSFTAAAGQRGNEPILFRGDTKASSFREKGDLASWVSGVAGLAIGQSRLLLSLGIAFAGPLLEPLGQEPGCFNVVGASSMGKTTALHLAGSVWGGGGPSGFALTWRTTSNALEGVCAQHNDSLLGLDELGMCPPNEVDAAAYSLTGGSGKSRLKSDGELRARTRWRVMVLSTGEVTLAQRIAEGGFGKTVKAGQTVRFIDLSADAGRGFGLFDHIDGFEGAAALAEAVRDRAAACYGLAGPAFVRTFLADPSAAKRVAKAVIDDFVARQVERGASGQVHRVALRFGLVAAAGELATSFGLIPVSAGAVTAAAEVIFRQWVEQRGGIGASEARSAVTQVRGFLQRHALARFVPASSGLNSGSWRAQNIAGFRTGEDDGADFLFTDEGFAEATTGLDRLAAADALHEAGFLKKDTTGRRKAVARIDGRPMRVFRVLASILDGEE